MRLPDVDAEQRALLLAAPGPVAGIAGPGRWLVAAYRPTALFSLKSSQATSSVGVSLLVPTPYAIKMALVDAAFRAGLSDSSCSALVRALAPIAIRIKPPEAAAVTHTFVKIRQESRTGDPLRPYGPNIAYREVVYHHGEWEWAFDLALGDDALAERLVLLTPHVNYIGKRGSFVQFLRLWRQVELSAAFTQEVHPGDSLTMPGRFHMAVLDDFGPEADLAVLSSFTAAPVRRDRHRRFVPTMIPLGLHNTGPGFSEYQAD
jgi:hypothetical protein